MTSSHNYHWKKLHFIGYFTKVTMDGKTPNGTGLVFWMPNLEQHWEHFTLISNHNNKDTAYLWWALNLNDSCIYFLLEFLPVRICRVQLAWAANNTRSSLHACTSHIVACTLLYYEDIFFLHLSKSTLITCRYVRKTPGKNRCIFCHLKLFSGARTN